MKKSEYVILGFILLLYAFVKFQGISYSISDENTYFFMAKTLADGKLPYRDFFLSHPPLQILILALAIKVAGVHFILLKLVSTLFIAGAGILLYLLGKRLYGRVVGFLALLLFLFSFDSLRFSTFGSGISITLFFLVLGYYLHFLERHAFAGASFALAVLTSYLAAPFGAFYIGYLFFKDRKGVLKAGLGFFGVILFALIALFSFSGWDFVEQTVLYHLAKPSSGTARFSLLFKQFLGEWLLFFPLLFLPFSKKARGHLILGSIVAYLLFLLSFQKPFAFYYFLLYPFLALLSASVVAGIGWMAHVKLTAAKHHVVFVLFFIVAALSSYSAFSYLIDNRQEVKAIPEMVEYINSHTTYSDSLFGDDSLVPLIALLSDRRISLDFLDLNNLRFRSLPGLAEETIERLKGSDLKYYLDYQIQIGNLVGRNGPSALDEFQAFLEEECSVEKAFSEEVEEQGRTYTLYSC